MKKITALIITFSLIIMCVPCAGAMNVVIFEDNFNNGTEQWSSLGYAYPSVVLETQTEDGNSIGAIAAQKVASQGVRIHSVTSGDLESNDYEFTGRMKISSGNEYAYILVRTASDKNYYGLWYNSYFGTVSLVKDNYTAAISGTSKSAASAGIRLNMWFDFKVVTSGNKIEFYILDMTNPVISYVDNDNPILTGGVGFGLYTGQPPEKAIYFDDIKVTYNDGNKNEYWGGKQPSSDVVGTEYEDASLLLSNLGIMDEYSEGKFSAESYVTRGEMADIALKMRNYTDILPVDKKPASDVNKTHKYAAQIKEIIAQDIMNSAELFRPDDAIKFEEAVTVCVRLLGYQPMANIKGGYAAGYIATARNIGLLNGIDAKMGYIMTRGDLAKLLYNTLEAPLMSPKIISDDITYEMDDRKNLLSEYFNVYSDMGIISATQNVALKLTSPAFMNRVKINGTEYEIALSEAQKYFGYNVRYYYYDDGDMRYIVSAVPKKNKVLTLRTEDIINFSNNTYSYNKNNKKASLSISVYETDVIYNGKSMVGNNYIPANGYVTFIDNNSDGTYDVADIRDYRIVIIDSVNKNEKVIVDRFDVKNNINLRVNNSDVSYMIKNTEGRVLKLEKVSPNTVASAAISEDGTLVEIMISSDKVTGEITATDIKNKTVKVSGKQYKTTADYADFDDIKVGTQMQLWLDFNGEIAYAVSAAGSDVNYAYILDSKVDRAFDEELLINVFSSSAGTIEAYALASSVIIDGEKITGIDSQQSKVKKGIAIIELNTDGQIKSIDYPYTTVPGAYEYADSFRYIAGGSDRNLRYKGWNQFWNLFTISGSTTVMTVPTDETQTELFAINGISGQFVNDVEYNVAAYSLKEDSYSADLVVKYITPLSSTSTAPLIVKEKYIGVNSEGEVTTLIKVLNTNGKEIVYPVTVRYMDSTLQSEIDSLGIGDAVRFRLSAENEIAKVSNVIYDCSTGTANHLGDATDLNYQYRSINGYIYSTQGSTIAINIDTPESGKPQNIDVSVSNGTVYIVNTSTGEIREAKTGEFKNYRLYGKDATPVLLIQYGLQNQLLVGYEK